MALLLSTCTVTHNRTQNNKNNINKILSISELPRESFVFVSVREIYNFCFKDDGIPICIEIGRPKYSTGSGFVVANNKHGSLVITAEHVCSSDIPGMNIEIMLTDLDGSDYKARVVAKDIKNDICMLTSKGLYKNYVKVSNVAPRPGDKLYNIAAPVGIFHVQMVPIMEGRYNGITKYDSAIYSIPAAPGSSGSMVLNESFEIVGLIHSLHIRFRQVSIGPKYESIKTFIKENIAKYN